MRVTVLGAGAWGTALARLLRQNHQQVTLWGHDALRLEMLRRTGRNDRYLPGIELPPDLSFEEDARRAVEGAEVLVVAVPSQAFRQVVSEVGHFRGIVVSVTKGIEHKTGLTMSGIVREVLTGCPVAALSGPTLALEVAQGIPAAIVAASSDLEMARQTQELFHRPTFRVYTSGDMLGVELGGALKNVIAIAAGVCDGLQFGDNSKAALVTRAIVEIRRLGVACGAQPDTFGGLSGLGDLAVTCFSRLSRNRGFGEELGRGKPIEAVRANMVAVAEGYPTALSAHTLAQRMGVETPIINEVYAMLYEKKNLAEAVHDLLSRDLKQEN